MYKWNEDTTCKFVTIYKYHECLWNSYTEDFKNREVRTLAYRMIAEAMGLPNFDAADVKSKIKNLRSTFAQESKKIQSASKSGNVYQPTIKWYEQMKELVDKGGPARNSFNNADILTQLKVETESGKQDQDYSSEDNTNSHPTYKRKCKKKRVDNCDYVSQLQDTPTTSNGISSWEDEFHHFGMNVAAQLRKLPIEKALHVQVTIQSLLAEERIAIIQS